METGASTIIDTTGDVTFVKSGGAWIRRNFENRGLAIFQAPVNLILQDGTFRNVGTANFEGRANVSWNGGVSHFINEGVINKSGPDTLQFTANAAVENHGQFNILSGIVEIDSSGINDSTIRVDQGGSLTRSEEHTSELQSLR